MSLLPASIKRIRSKTTEKGWRHHLIRPKIEIDDAFMPVLVTSNFDDDSIKNEQASKEALEIFKFESVDDDGPLVYYKLTL